MMETFLQQTARSIIDSMDWKALSRTTLVLPSHRAGIVLKDELMRLQQERQMPAVWAPKVRTLPQLQDYLSPLYPEDELFTIVRLYKLYLSTLQSPMSDPIPLDLFYGWGRQMLADFTNVDASMPAPQVPNFFENTIAAHELEEWKLDKEVEERLRALMDPISASRHLELSSESIKAQYELLWKQLYELYVALRAEMIAEQKGYNGLRQRAVIEHWEDEDVQQKIAGQTFIFVGFNYLLPVERELMIRLRDAGQARFYWDYVTDFQTNEKAFSFAQLNSGILGSALPPRQGIEPKPVTVMSCISREAQAQYVHRWLLENYTHKGQRVGVVICDETMLEPVIYTLPAITLPGETEPAPVNITKGFPLRNTHIYARVLAWLNDRQHGQAEDIVSPEFIDRMLAEVFETSTSQDIEISTAEEESASLSWQELLILESEYQVRKILNQMRLLITQGIGDIPFTHKLVRLLMRRTMESITLPFHGEPVTDIQVMGVLETRLLDFDNLLILNVEEGVLPQHQMDNSFIPYYLRKTYSMQTSDERATVYAYNFFRLLSRAGHTTLLYATAETAEGGKGKSRFIMQMLVSPEFTVEERYLTEPSILNQTPLDIHYAPKTIKRPNHLSPSALNTYIGCPRSYYLRYIEGLRQEEEPDVLFEAATMGSFVHKAIEYLYRTYLHCDSEKPVEVLPEEIDKLTKEDILDDALRAAYEQMDQYVLEEHRSENKVIKGYIKNILERDKEDAKRGLQIVLLEKERYFPLTIDGIGEIRMGGTIDRLDIVGTGADRTLRVVDYKSGNYNKDTHKDRMTATWEDIMDSEDKGYVRQTLIYSLAVLQSERTKLPIEPHLFFCRRKLTDIETTIDVENETVHDVRTIRDPFIDALRAKMTELLTASDFPQCEPDKCPSFCPFFALCGRKPQNY